MVFSPFKPDLFDDAAVIEADGTSFEVDAQIARAPRRRHCRRSLGPEEWFGNYQLRERAQQASFNSAVTKAVRRREDVVLRLPDGRHAAIEIDGEWYTGVSVWPE
jgi:hypothetical protein